jgi:hypothetical protein
MVLVKLESFSNSNVSLIVVPSHELFPYVVRIMNSYSPDIKYILLAEVPEVLYNRTNELNKTMLVNISNSVVLYITSSYLTEHIVDNECDYYYSSYKDIQYNSIKLNIKINTLIIHNFASGLNETIFFDFLQSINTVLYSESYKIICYADGSRNNYIAETSFEKCPDMFAILKASNKICELFFFGFKHNTYTGTDYKILKYENNLKIFPPILDENLGDTKQTAVFGLNFKDVSRSLEYNPIKNYGLVLSRYFGYGPYMFNPEVSIEAVMATEICDIFRSIGYETYIKFDDRIKLNTTEIINCARNICPDTHNLDDLFPNCNNYLTEHILLHNLIFLRNIKRIYTFDGSFPLMFQIPELYNNLNIDIEIYIGFNIDTFSKYADKMCIDTLSKRTFEIIVNLIKLKLFNIYSGQRLLNDKTTIDELISNNNYLFIARLPGRST